MADESSSFSFGLIAVSLHLPSYGSYCSCERMVSLRIASNTVWEALVMQVTHAFDLLALAC